MDIFVFPDIGAGEDIRGKCSQTTLSKPCCRKASETSSGPVTHTTRHQQGGGQCLKVGLSYSLFWYFLLFLSFSFLNLSSDTSAKVFQVFVYSFLLSCSVLFFPMPCISCIHISVFFPSLPHFPHK